MEREMELTKQNSVDWIWNQIEQIPEYPKDKYQGRGICFIAGGNKYWVNAYASIRLLREKGCKLPINAYYLGDKGLGYTPNSSGDMGLSYGAGGGATALLGQTWISAQYVSDARLGVV